MKILAIVTITEIEDGTIPCRTCRQFLKTADRALYIQDQAGNYNLSHTFDTCPRTKDIIDN